MSADDTKKKDPFGSFDNPVFKDGNYENLFESHTPFGRSETGFLAGRSFNVAANVFESRDGLVITIDCPGIQREDVDIRLTGNRLTISGKREFVREFADEEFLRLERGFGSFRRDFEVPPEVDETRLSARLENGVLKIIVPVKQKRLDIKVESGE